MKPKFHKELEKLLGPVAAREFMDEHFVRLAGSRHADTAGMRTEKRRRTIINIKNDFLEQISGQIKPAEEVKTDRVETFLWEIFMPKEFAKNG